LILANGLPRKVPANGWSNVPAAPSKNGAEIVCPVFGVGSRLAFAAAKWSLAAAVWQTGFRDALTRKPCASMAASFQNPIF
jgi:hypothetical protein